MDKRLLEMIDKHKCVALIPARGGSKSVPKKNIREFMGHPLIAYSIAVALMSERIERVIVTTDSEEIAAIARHYGAEVPFLRPAEYAQDDSQDIDFVKHAVGWLADNEGKIPEYIVHLRVTSPIRDYRIVDEGIEAIIRDKDASSLRSGHLCVHPPYKWFRLDDTSYAKPLMPGMTCDEANMPRQGFPKVLVPNGYVDVLRASYVVSNDLMHGDHMIGFVTEEIPDIDTEQDLYKLQVYRGVGTVLEELHEFLENVKAGHR